MAKEKSTSAPPLLLLLLAVVLAGCAPSSSIFCEPSYYGERSPVPSASPATIAVLPFCYTEDVPEDFAWLAGERLYDALDSQWPAAIGPREVISKWKEATHSPWGSPRGTEAFKALGRMLGASVAILGTATRYVYGGLNPTEIACSISVVNMSSGQRMASFNVSALSRKAFSYSALSKPPEPTESLLEKVMTLSAAPSVIRAIGAKRSIRQRGRSEETR
ncbi:MAG TPA: hypothetical protein VM163_05550 [bacterium]|nr:hypothetical protein [bacterium]